MTATAVASAASGGAGVGTWRVMRIRLRPRRGRHGNPGPHMHPHCTNRRSITHHRHIIIAYYLVIRLWHSCPDFAWPCPETRFVRPPHPVHYPRQVGLQPTGRQPAASTKARRITQPSAACPHATAAGNCRVCIGVPLIRSGFCPV